MLLVIVTKTGADPLLSFHGICGAPDKSPGINAVLSAMSARCVIVHCGVCYDSLSRIRHVDPTIIVMMPVNAGSPSKTIMIGLASELSMTVC